MANIFVVSDTHFSHENILTFRLEDGSPMRDFASVKQMDDFMVAQWNAVVRPQDHVYHLGDVAMHKQGLRLVRLLNGHKRLVLGNHDVYSVETYKGAGFEKIFGSRVLDNMLMTHLPVHPASLGRFEGNVHGHVHNNVPALHFGPRYLNVSVEAIDYRPRPLEEVRKLLVAQKEAAGIPLAVRKGSDVVA